MAQIANGATIALSGITGITTAVIESINVTENGQAIDVTGIADAMHYFALGLPQYGYTFGIVGELTAAIGTVVSAASITWPGGSAKTSRKMAVSDCSQSGSVDTKITTNLSLVCVR